MHLGKEEWQQAQKKFEKIIEKDRADPYSLLSLGNVCVLPSYYYNTIENSPTTLPQCYSTFQNYFLSLM
jgi:RNA polymerase-associated protein CTR9